MGSQNEEAPRGIDPNHWKELLENENKPKKKEQKIKNTENRAQLQYSHCLGRYSYAQKTYELVYFCVCVKFHSFSLLVLMKFTIVARS